MFVRAMYLFRVLERLPHIQYPVEPRSIISSKPKIRLNSVASQLLGKKQTT